MNERGRYFFIAVSALAVLLLAICPPWRLEVRNRQGTSLFNYTVHSPFWMQLELREQPWNEETQKSIKRGETVLYTHLDWDWIAIESCILGSLVAIVWSLFKVYFLGLNQSCKREEVTKSALFGDKALTLRSGREAAE